MPIEHHPEAGDYVSLPSPVVYGSTPAGLRRFAPRIGQHTSEVLREAGYADGEIERLADTDVIRLAERDDRLKGEG
jgi:formyl-CoA transferase